MSKKGRRCTPEQIITKLREAEVLHSQGLSIEEVVRKLDIASQTYYRWRKEYGDMDTTQARKLKDLEKENLRLKKLVVDLLAKLMFHSGSGMIPGSRQPRFGERLCP